MGIHTCPWLSISISMSPCLLPLPVFGVSSSPGCSKFWPLSSQFSVLCSQFWTLDFASGSAQSQVECTFCVKVCEFHVCVCVLVLCFVVFVCCFVAHSETVGRSDRQTEAQLLEIPNSWHADHINLSSLCKISCMIWPLPAPAPDLESICITLWSVGHMFGSSMSVFVCGYVYVCAVEWTRWMNAWNV